MNKKVCVGIAALLTGTLLLFTYIQVYGGKKEEYRIVCLGDSIIGNVRDETSVTSVMEDILGEPVANGAFGGSCMSLANTGYRSTFYEDSINMAELAESISGKDFTSQFMDIDANHFALDYFKECLVDLSKIDYSKTEILFIEHGTNDYNSGRPLDNPGDPYDVFTFGGALRYSIERLKEAYPTMEIVLVTPTYCYFLDGYDRAEDCLTSDFGYGPLENYVNLELEIGREYGLDVIDNYHNIGIDELTIDEYADDGIHLNKKGRRLLAETLADYVINHRGKR